MFITGMGMMRQMAATNTILQTIAEEEKRGRVMSYYTMAFVGMAPFGSLLAGSLAARIGAPATLLISGLCCLAGVAWFGMHLKELRRAVRPIYIELGILPEIATGIQTASALQVPPED
jgi:MFS family permease